MAGGSREEGGGEGEGEEEGEDALFLLTTPSVEPFLNI